MTINITEQATHEPTLEVLIRAVARLTLRNYMNILTEVRLSLEEVDKIAMPRNASRVDWGIRELSTTRKDRDVRVVLAPAKRLARREPGTLSLPTHGLVNGIQNLQEEALIPAYFSARTVERVQRMGLGIDRGDVAAVELTSMNGRQEKAVVDQGVIAKAKEAVRGASTTWSSAVGTLAVLDLKNPEKPRAEISLASRGAVVVHAKAADVDQLRALWGQRVLAVGELTRNALGQPVRLKMESLDALPGPSERLTAWDILGIAPRATGDLTTSEYIEVIRGR